MAENTKASLRDRKKFNKTKATALLLIMMVLAIVILSFMYNGIHDEAKAVKKMKIYNLSGSSDVVNVSGVNLEYNGVESLLAGGTCTYSGKTKDITSYTYTLFVQEPGKDEKITLLSNQIIGGNPDLSIPFDIGSVKKTPEAGIDYKNFASKYTVGFRLDLTTTKGLITEEVFLKINELDTDFFRNAKF